MQQSEYFSNELWKNPTATKNLPGGYEKTPSLKLKNYPCPASPGKFFMSLEIIVIFTDQPFTLWEGEVILKNFQSSA